MRRPSSLAGFILIVVLSVACSGEKPVGTSATNAPDGATTSTSTTAPPDQAGGAVEACSLLTEQEAESALSRELKAPVPSSTRAGGTDGASGQLSLCTWDNEARTFAEVESACDLALSVAEQARLEEGTVQDLYERARNERSSAQDLSDLGDVGFSAGREVFFVKGKIFVEIECGVIKSDAKLNAGILSLARLVASRV